MFCDEKLRKIKFRAFLQEVGLWILSLESVNYFGTSEHYSGRKKKNNLFKTSKTGMVGCCKLSLYANGLVMSIIIYYFRRWLKWCAMKITLVISGNDVIFLESRLLNFRLFIHAYSVRPQRYFRSSLTRVLNQFFSEWILFREELITSLFQVSET